MEDNTARYEGFESISKPPPASDIEESTDGDNINTDTLSGSLK